MTRRIVSFREHFDRLLDYTPAADLPAWPDSLFTTSPSNATSPAGTARGQHSAAGSGGYLLLPPGPAAHVPGDRE